MSTINIEHRKVAAKTFKDDVNIVLKNATNQKETTTSKVKISKLKKQDNVDTKEILVSFYDKLLNDSARTTTSARGQQKKLNSGDDAPIKLKESKIAHKKTTKSNNNLVIPCTNDLCAKVRQLVQMNTDVQRFRKKFLEPQVLDNNEKKTLHQKKIEAGNQFSKRNLSSFKKNFLKSQVKIVKEEDEEEDDDESEEERFPVQRVKSVGWNPQTLITPNVLGSSSTESLVSKADEIFYPSYEVFIDCYENETLYSAQSLNSLREINVNVSKGIGQAGADSDYLTCTDDSNEKTTSKGIKIPVRKSSSAKMLLHFKQLLNQHTLQKNAEQIKSAVLTDDDVQFLKNIVEADERYRYLKREDHELLKDVLKAQLKQIEYQERILGEALRKLRGKTGSSETVVVMGRDNLKENIRCSSESKENAEQPLENSANLAENNSTASPRDKTEFVTPCQLDIDLRPKKSARKRYHSSEEVSIMLGIPIHGSKSPCLIQTPELLGMRNEEELSVPESNNNLDLIYVDRDYLRSISKSASDTEELQPLSFSGAIKSFLMSASSNKGANSDALSDISNNTTLPLDSGRNASPRSIGLCRSDTDEPHSPSVKTTKKSLKLLPSQKRASSENRSDVTHKKLESLNVAPSLELENINYEDSIQYLNEGIIAYSARSSEARKEHLVEDNCTNTPDMILKNIDSAQQETQILRAISSRLEKTCEKVGSTVEQEVVYSDLHRDIEIDMEIEALLSSRSKHEGEECIKDAITTSKLQVEKCDVGVETKVKMVYSNQCGDNIIRFNPIEFITMKIEDFVIYEVYPSAFVHSLHIFFEECLAKEFRVKYLSLDELKSAGEFYIFRSKLQNIEPERTNFEDLQSNPEELAKLLRAKADENAAENKHPDKWQANIFNVPDDVIMKKVICCFFKTWATYPDLYSRGMSPLTLCLKVPNQTSEINQRDEIDDSESAHGKIKLDQSPENGKVQGITDNLESPVCCECHESILPAVVLEDKESLSTVLTNSDHNLLVKNLKKRKVKNAVVFFAQFVLFVLLVLGLSMPDFIC